MSIKTFLAYTAIPAAVGATTGYLANQMGYDFSATEGMKQLVMAGLPLAILGASDNYHPKHRFDVPEAREYIKGDASTPLLLATGSNVTMLSLGGLAMQCLTNQDMNLNFIASAGAIEGLLFGAFSIAKLTRKEKR